MDKYPKVKETYYYALSTSTRVLYIAATQWVTAVGAVWAAAAAIQNAAFYSGEGGDLDTIAKANPSNTQIHVEGYLPHSVFEIPFGQKNEPDDWYDVRGLGNLKLDVTGGATAASTIFLQQVRNY
jgi:hypothetical protein